MSSQFKMSILKLCDELALEEIYMVGNKAEIFIHSADANRPGLALAGFFEVFDNERIQILGKTEITYILGLDEETQIERLLKFCSYMPPAVIVARNLEIPSALFNAAKVHGIPVFRSSETTSEVVASAIAALSVGLAQRITRHGVLLELYGDGVLILGESGVGKSETAVELIARGHCLIADDAVEIRKVSGRSLVGSSPENIRHFMELRGIGVVNIRRMFGMAAVKITAKIELIINLELWNDSVNYDRLGTENLYMEVMGIKVPTVTIPVKPGRNLAVIIEAATMNLRLKKMGYHPTRELMQGLGMPEDSLPPVEKIVGNSNWDIL